MKTFLTVMVFTCIACFALNADEQNGTPAQNQKSSKDKEMMSTPKKDMPAKAPQLLSAGEKDKMPAKEEESPSKKQMKDKLLADNEQKTKESQSETALLAAKFDDADQKDIKKTADTKSEEEKKMCSQKTLIAGVACTKDSDDKSTQKNDEKSMKPAQKLA